MLLGVTSCLLYKDSLDKFLLEHGARKIPLSSLIPELLYNEKWVSQCSSLSSRKLRDKSSAPLE